MGLNGKRILVVGGGSGIGLAVAKAALASGAEVVVASPNLEKVGLAAERLGEGASSAGLDIADEAAVAAFFEGSGPFDHIVTTAGDWGGARPARLGDLDLKASEGVWRVRFWGAVALAKHGARALAPDGSITLTGGMIAHRPAVGSAISTAMAGAIEHLTRSLAFELAPRRVNAVCPGPIRSGIWLQMPSAQRETLLTAMTERQLLKRAGQPDEAAAAYIYLLLGGFTTGQVLYVEGGSTLGA